MLRTKLDMQPRYAALHEIIANIKSSRLDASASETWAETIEAVITERELSILLGAHDKDEVISKEMLQKWQTLFANRWSRVKGTPLAYPYNTSSPTNQIYLALADFFQPYLNIPRFQLLMPDIESASSSITMTDLLEVDLSVTDIVLSDDSKNFIEVKACLFSAVEDMLFKHTQLLENGKGKLLSSQECQRVISHHPAARALYDAMQKRYDFKHNGTTIGACLQILIDGLRAGGVDRSRNNQERDINEMNATEPANLAILNFGQVYDALSDAQRDELNALRDDHHNFWYYWDILALHQQRKIDEIKSNTNLSAAQRASALRDVHASITTCVQITANGLEAILEMNQEKLFSMRLGVDDSQKNHCLLAHYDEELQRRKSELEESMRLFANGLPFQAEFVEIDEYSHLEAAVIRWLNSSNKLSYQAVMATALRLIRVDTVFENIFPKLHLQQRKLAKRLFLPVLKNNFPLQITATSTHSYILDKNGRMTSCGDSRSYGLSKVYNFIHRKHIPVFGLSHTKITQIAGGLNHVLCLTEHGDVYGRGQSDSGQLGFFGQHQSGFMKITGLPAATNIIKIMSHLNDSVLISADAKVYLLGESVQSDSYADIFPAVDGRAFIREIKGLPANIEIAQSSFSQHLLIVTTDGRVFAAGNSEFGQLGFKSYDDITDFIEVSGFPVGVKLVQAAAGNIHTLFLADDGKVYSCGSNMRGQQGSIRHKNLTSPRLVTGLPLDDKVIEIAAGLYNSYFLTERGRVFACGWNVYGQLGLGDNESRDRVTELTGFPPGTRITRVSPSMEVDSCTFFFSADGNVYGCGRDNLGHLGFPAGSDTSRPQLLPHLVSLNSRIVEIETALSRRRRQVHGRFFAASDDAEPEQGSFITEYPSPEMPHL